MESGSVEIQMTPGSDAPQDHVVLKDQGPLNFLHLTNMAKPKLRYHPVTFSLLKNSKDGFRWVPIFGLN